MITQINAVQRLSTKPTPAKGVLHFLKNAYNPETKEIWGRNAKRWGFLVTYYICFYAGLVLFWALLYVLWRYVILDRKHPLYKGPEQGLNWTPGLGFWPMLDPERFSTMLRFHRANETMVFGIRDKIYFGFLMGYEREYWISENGNFIDCTQGRADPDPTKVCEFKLDWVLPCRFEDEYGYADGIPCVFLKLNKVYDWVPENYDSIDEVPEEIKDIWEPNVIAVKCFGDDPVSKEYVDDHVSYYPRQGWSFDYFPYLGQQGYKSPLVAVQFDVLPHRTAVFIICKAYTKNMVYDMTHRIGLTRFEIISD